MNTIANIPAYNTHNQLLDALPPAIQHLLVPHLKECHLPLGTLLHDSGEHLPYIYFPVGSIVSLVYVTKAGKTAEISMIGKEGLVGVAKFMGGESTPTLALVQRAGTAMRLPSHILMEEFNRHGELHALILRYTQALFTQMAQVAVCYRYHSVHEQLCRWLLLFMDRVPGNNLEVTHELIASMLGVRRESISSAASNLQKQGVIRNIRGCITVLNRSLLVELGCECYSVVRNESDRLISCCSPALELNQHAFQVDRL